MKTFLEKIALAAKSRTTWVAVLLYLANNQPHVEALLPLEWKATFNTVLGLAIVYFHINPSQDYKKPL